jgi:uncharacterized protein (TIGR02444 family)
MSAGQDFWDFSLAVYRQPGVPEECLALQERLGADVNLLLLCAYLGATRKALLDSNDIRAAVAASTAWHTDIVRNLRAARQALKPWEEGRDKELQDSSRTLRSAVKKLELDAERIEHDLLANWANGRNLKSSSPDAAVSANIRTLVEYYQPAGDTASPPNHLVAAAVSLAAR